MSDLVANDQVFRTPFDILGGVIYGSELILWIGIMLCGLYFGTADVVDEDVQLGPTATSPREEVEEGTERVDMGRSTSRLSIGKLQISFEWDYD
jgi:hypothetical protein